jgi:hypothetical protein
VWAASWVALLAARIDDNACPRAACTLSITVLRAAPESVAARIKTSFLAAREALLFVSAYC